jgi:hypothetical protein
MFRAVHIPMYSMHTVICDGHRASESSPAAACSEANLNDCLTADCFLLWYRFFWVGAAGEVDYVSLKECFATLARLIAQFPKLKVSGSPSCKRGKINKLSKQQNGCTASGQHISAGARVDWASMACIAAVLSIRLWNVSIQLLK